MKDYIIDPDKTSFIRQLIKEGVSQYGMQSSDQALAHLVHRGVVVSEDALRFATHPNELALHLQGIQDSSNRTFSAVEMNALEKAVTRGLPDWMAH